MKCNDVKKELYFYITNELEPSKKSEIENHLTKCSICSSLLNNFSKTLETIDKTPVNYPIKNWDYNASEILESIHRKKRVIIWKPALVFAFSLFVFIVGYKYFHQKKIETADVTAETEELVAYLSNFDIPELYQ